MDALRLHDCQKIYDDGTVAVNGISLSIQPGEFVALLGPNGAGKTTLIGMITGLVNKSGGRIEVFGHDVDDEANAAKSCIGIVPQEFNFHIFETVEQIILNQAGYYGIPRTTAQSRLDQILKQLHLSQKRHTQARWLSGGMKRRLMIARALIHQPKLLILDEPTAGVDIEIRRQMWAFLQTVNQEGLTILLTTHYLEEAEYLCDRTAIINHGQIVEDDKTSKLLRRLPSETFVFTLREPHPHLPEGTPYTFRQIDDETLEMDLMAGQHLNDVFDVLSQHGLQVISLKNKSNRLENFFMRRLSESQP